MMTNVNRAFSSVSSTVNVSNPLIVRRHFYLLLGCVLCLALLGWSKSAFADFVAGKNAISYKSEQSQIAANLYLPDDFDATQRYPLIVFSRPPTGVKEQVAGVYAAAMSKLGYVTIAFDPRGFGESEGRSQDESPLNIVRDIQNTITYASTLGFVDTDNVFTSGMCMGAGYATYAAAIDQRVKAAAAISPYLTLHIDYPKTVGGAHKFNKLMRIANFSRFITDRFGVDFYIFAVPRNALQARLPGQTPIAKGMMTYYLPGERGEHPNWVNKFNLYNIENLVANYDPFTILDLYQNKPFYMAYGTEGYSVDKLQEFYDGIQSSDQNKQLRVLPGNHFDFYWQPQLIKTVTQDLDAFFKRYR